MLFEYPTEEDWEKIARDFPFEKLNVRIGDFKKRANSNDLEEFFGNIELQTWTMHLQSRLFDVFRSFVLLMYYYQKGIPDAEWFISPGKRGQSVEYFPHFETRHYLIKDQFDFYVDIFYYKVFAAWDTLGHILNVLFEMGIEKPSFKSAINHLERRDHYLWSRLRLILSDPEFERANKIRNSITHNFQPNLQSSGVARPEKNTYTFGVGDYTTSKMITDNVLKSLELFEKTLEIIRA